VGGGLAHFKTDISIVQNLSQAQVNSARGTRGENGTILPVHFTVPDHWEILGDEKVFENGGEPDNWEAPSHPWYQTAKIHLAPVTPIADVEWTKIGELNVQNLTPITPTPRKPVPIPSPEAVFEIKRTLVALSKQLRIQLNASESHNTAAFIGDADPLFAAIETQLELPDVEIIPLCPKHWTRWMQSIPSLNNPKSSLKSAPNWAA